MKLKKEGSGTLPSPAGGTTRQVAKTYIGELPACVGMVAPQASLAFFNLKELLNLFYTNEKQSLLSSF